MLAPIILFVYKKYRQTSLVVDALKQSPLCKKSDLYIFSDAPKGREDAEAARLVRNYIRQISGFKSIKIVKKDINRGLRYNYITGVDEVLKSHDSFIVVEDDVMTNPYFLKYMNDALVFYKDTKEVFSVSSYNLPPSLMSIPSYYTKDVYFNPRMLCWGFASWKDRWDKVDWDVLDYEKFMDDKAAQKEFNKAGLDLTPMLKDKMDGRIDTWDITFDYSQFRNKGLCVCPIHSLSSNIGFGLDSTHTKGENQSLINNLDFKQQEINFPKKPFVDKALIKEFARYYNRGYRLYRIAKPISPLIPKSIKSFLKKTLRV